MRYSRTSPYHWVFYLTTGLLFAGTIFRAPLSVEGTGTTAASLALLVAWLALFLIEMAILPPRPLWFAAYLIGQTLIVAGLLSLPGNYDFFAVLFAPLAMQTSMRYGWKPGVASIVVFAAITAVILRSGWSPAETAAFVLLYTVLSASLALYALGTRKAAQARARNQALAERLQAANEQLSVYSAQLQRAAITRERNRVARELHDSVTQTIFSMNLSSQSAILLAGQPDRVRVQLDRVSELARSALAEMQRLILELAPETAGEGGLPEALRKEIRRRAEDGFRVTLTIDEPPVGAGSALSPAEEQNLLRIAQEALNNAAKHSGSDEAAIRLRLWAPPRLEIEDRGQGFLPGAAGEAGRGGGIGLASMKERASEIGWRMEIRSTPGEGTRVMVQRPTEEAGA